MSNQHLFATRAVSKCKEVKGLIESRAQLSLIITGMEELETITKAVMVKEAMGRATSLERVRLLTRQFEQLVELLETA